MELRLGHEPFCVTTFSTNDIVVFWAMEKPHGEHASREATRVDCRFEELNAATVIASFAGFHRGLPFRILTQAVVYAGYYKPVRGENPPKPPSLQFNECYVNNIV